MPRLAGVNLVAWLAAAIAIYAIGMVIYGFTLTEVWGNEMLKNHGLAAPDGPTLSGDALMAQLNKIPGALDAGMSYGLGFVIALVTALGICIAQRLMKPQSLGAALGNGFVLWFGFAATTLAYNVVYASNSRIILGIDMLHLFLDYLAASAVVFVIDGKALRGA